MAFHSAGGKQPRVVAKIFPDLVQAYLGNPAELRHIRRMSQLGRAVIHGANNLFSAHGFSNLIVEDMENEYLDRSRPLRNF
jgi:hypothetical protein